MTIAQKICDFTRQFTVPMAKIISVKNAQTRVSMVLYLKKDINLS